VSGETLCQWNCSALCAIYCNALCAVYCNLNLNNIECSSKFSGHISSIIKKRFTHSHHKMCVYSNKIPGNGNLYFVSQIKCETLLVIQNYRKIWQRSWQAWPTARLTYHLHYKKTNFTVVPYIIYAFLHTHTHIYIYIYTLRPYAPTAFTPRKCSWYSYLLEAESIPMPWCDRKDFMSMKNSNDTSWDRTSNLPICSTAPLPLCHRGHMHTLHTHTPHTHTHTHTHT